MGAPLDFGNQKKRKEKGPGLVDLDGEWICEQRKSKGSGQPLRIDQSLHLEHRHAEAKNQRYLISAPT
jgi:hypothetical protein